MPQTLLVDVNLVADERSFDFMTPTGSWSFRLGHPDGSIFFLRSLKLRLEAATVRSGAVAASTSLAAKENIIQLLALEHGQVGFSTMTGGGGG